MGAFLVITISTQGLNIRFEEVIPNGNPKQNIKLSVVEAEGRMTESEKSNDLRQTLQPFYDRASQAEVLNLTSLSSFPQVILFYFFYGFPQQRELRLPVHCLLPLLLLLFSYEIRFYMFENN